MPIEQVNNCPHIVSISNVDMDNTSNNINYETKSSDEVIKTNIENIGDNYEQRFKYWFEKQKTNSGIPYKTYTIYNYIDRLKNAAAKIKSIKIDNTNLFYYTTYESFFEVYNIIRSAPDFDNVNNDNERGSWSNGAFGSAMKKYMEFLLEIGSQTNRKTYSGNNSNKIDTKFGEWMAKRQKKGGGLYSINTINAYRNALKTSSSKIKGLKLANYNLFSYTNIHDFSIVHKAIVAIPEFDEIDYMIGHRTFSNAMNMYMEFLRETDGGENEALQLSLNNDVLSNDVQPSVPIVNPSPSKIYTYNLDDAWPKWEIPDQATLLKMAKLVTPYVRFLLPAIIKIIVEDNEINRNTWASRLAQAGIEPGYYLWENCSCVFPAIRRYSGSAEIAYFRKQFSKRDLKIEDALEIDDNSYPKQIWSFILRGKKFQNFGPQSYSLAHLADHKDYKNRKNEEFDLTEEAPGKVYGLYTCASNSVYLPNNLIKPTDFNREIRLLLMHKAQDLYGGVCNLFPPSFKLKRTSSLWDIDNFDWAEPVGNIKFMPTFLEYRREVMGELLKL